MDHTIVHFEIPADDPERAAAFYTDVFGWNITKAGPMDYWMLKTVTSDEKGMAVKPGANGGMFKRMFPGQTPINYIAVEDVDAHAARVVEAGGELVSPKHHVPGHGWLIQFKDPEGNVLSLWQGEQSAA